MSGFKCGIDAVIEESRFHNSDQDLDAINRHTLKPVTKDDIAVFRMDLCNDQVDRHFSRFPQKELRAINDMIVGKPLMELHDTHGRQPLGKFFQSRMNKDGGNVSVQPDCFILRTPANEEMIRNIEAGICCGTSIGFSFENPECSICEGDLRECSHYPGIDYDGERCHYVMHDVSDVYEGSVVPLGSQGTEFIEARATEETFTRFLPLINTRGKTAEERNPALAKARAEKTPIELIDKGQPICLADSLALQMIQAEKTSAKVHELHRINN